MGHRSTHLSNLDQPNVHNACHFAIVDSLLHHKLILCTQHKQWLCPAHCEGLAAIDRDGGIGGMDIYMSEIDGENYRRPLNAGRTINTVGDEVSPFFHNDKQTLYFSSDYMPGMGGFDIFYARFQKGGFDLPDNMGVPLNSAANDLYFIINPGDTSGFFSSNRPGSQILTGEACCNDIYKIIFPAFPTEKENFELDSAETERIVEQLTATKEEEIAAADRSIG